MLHRAFSNKCSECRGPQPSPSQIKRLKVIPPTNRIVEGKLRMEQSGHRRSACPHVIVLIFPLSFFLYSSCLNTTSCSKPIKLWHKIRATHAPIKLLPAPPCLNLFLSFFSLLPILRSQITLTETKLPPRSNCTLILYYIGFSFMCLHLLYSIPITGTPKLPLRYRTYNMLCQQVAHMPVYLRQPSYFLRGELNPVPKFSQFYSSLPCPHASVSHPFSAMVRSGWCTTNLSRQATVQLIYLSSSYQHPLISVFPGIASTTLNHATQDSMWLFLFPLLNATQITGLQSCGPHLS